MTDGAHLGVGADTALSKILGGKDILDDQILTEAEFEEMIRTAGFTDLDYGTSSNAIARMILEAYEKYPQVRAIPSDTEYLKDENGRAVFVGGNMVALGVDLYRVIKQIYAEEPHKVEILEGSTGFMFGWAVNAARKILGEGPVANPAILEF
jgi:hypothetical protein